ncbi:MAG TPA: Ser-Thr-rich GPI-anchored membrane family protein [Fulvivirga sp.]|nr:Ser-Thr-rich GPI-anchored membrane family protein [Fulvivirga sp.]
MKINYFIIILLVICSTSLMAQSLTNIKAQLVDEKVIISYDLTTPAKDHKFDVELYSSDNNYRAPLTLVKGDVGKEILPGTQKRIEWDAKSELKKYKGNITFEIRATLVAAMITFKNPIDDTQFRRGRTYQIDWSGGKNNPKFDLDLYRNNVKMEAIGKTDGKKNYTWTIPMSRKPGKYQIKLVDNQTNVATTHEFKIGRKIPLVLKVAPILVVGALVGVLATGGGGGETPPVINPEVNNLPDPPGTPGN